MKNLINFALREKYKKVKELRYRLEDMKELINWGQFTEILPKNVTTMGRPEYDKILMLKILFLQGWYSISDQETEFQIYDTLSFQQLLDYPEPIPDFSTIWRFREELTEADITDKIWKSYKPKLKIRAQK